MLLVQVSAERIAALINVLPSSVSVCVCVQYLYADARILILHSDDHASWYILVVKPTRCSNFSNLFWNKTTCFGQFLCPSSGVSCCTHSNSICHTGFADSLEAGSGWYCLQAVSKTCMTYTVALCTVWNSWWWTEELSETCRVLCSADHVSL